MIVIDASVFIDLLFEYDSERTRCAEEVLSIIEENGLTIIEPDIFKVELIGQISRRASKEKALNICEEIFSELAFVETAKIYDDAFSIALETGSRASDAFYIACAIADKAIIISNDKFQANSARRFGIEVYYLLHDLEPVSNRLLEMACK
ncbi:MAG TPA: type II toxin-antitoxin system VapC family toxin [Methanothrix sp.]|nr:type II toxin-antitoxin system VapC family toxin [Methanothrix sp.]